MKYIILGDRTTNFFVLFTVIVKLLKACHSNHIQIQRTSNLANLSIWVLFYVYDMVCCVFTLVV